MVEKHTAPRSVGIFGEPRVNVFELNMDLRQRYPKP
jgi:K+-transporting ATPase c subunit